MDSIKTIPYSFVGSGDVKGFIFTKVASTHHRYLYKVDSGDTDIYFEIFKRKTAPICIDFEKRIYSDTEFKEVYPKSKDFGSWAWTTSSIDKAYEYLIKNN